MRSFTAFVTRLSLVSASLTAIAACGGGYAAMDAKMAGAPTGYAAPPSATMVTEADSPQAHNTEAYAHIEDNPFLAPDKNPLSTFSVDVDTASYTNTRRILSEGRLPPKDAVRIEEMVNYFTYDYPQPTDARPFAVNVEVTDCPWKSDHRLLRIGLKGREIAEQQMPARNLVFLLDVSGSMNDANKLPLVKAAMKLLGAHLSPQDKVSIVVYAGASGLALPPTSDRAAILSAIDHLEAGGSTNGGEGIRLAYRTARANFDPKGINRVILATDGDFNVGTTSEGDLVRLIEDERKSGVFLTVLGVGTGNVKDATMEKLADKGNGNYAYLDSIAEAKKVLVTQAGGTLVTIAKDVKLQVEFNPKKVSAYRLIGYENRMLRAEDFKDDKKDAGEIGAGHTVTALYEIVPPGVASPAQPVDPLKYQSTAAAASAGGSNETCTLKLRYKEPKEEQSREVVLPIVDGGGKLAAASTDTRFAASVAAFGMILRESPHKGDSSYSLVKSLAEGAKGADKEGYRVDFLRMVSNAESLGSKPVAR